MPSNKHFLFSLSAFVFFILMIIGFNLSMRKLVWIDEFFTQKRTIEERSYQQIITLQFPEFNKSPLFYIIQKSVAQLSSFRLRTDHLEDISRLRDKGFQTIMRTPSNFYMSLSLTLIFLFFARTFSICAGLFALATALTTPMIWMYWVEARPYSLWFLLTTSQLILFSKIIIDKTATTKKTWLMNALLLIHLLLAFTAVASIFQIILIAGMTYWLSGRKLSTFIKTLIFPIGIIWIYLINVKSVSLNLTYFWAPFFDVMMFERIFIYIFYAIFIFIIYLKRKVWLNSFFLLVFLGFSLAVILIVYKFYHQPNAQFGFNSRYLIFIVPADIILMAFVAIDFIKTAWSKRFITFNIMTFLVCIMVLRGMFTYMYIQRQGLYLNSPVL